MTEHQCYKLLIMLIDKSSITADLKIMLHKYLDSNLRRENEAGY